MYAARKAVHTSSLVLFACPNGLSFARLGVSVGSKHGNAVRRNRIKRVLRAAFRLSRHLLPPGNDYVLVPKRGRRGMHHGRGARGAGARGQAIVDSRLRIAGLDQSCAAWE